MSNVIEQLAHDEYHQTGASAGAAARQLCCSLRCAGNAPTLVLLLEDLLSEGNLRSFDRAAILRAFDAAAPDAAQEARRESFSRLNGKPA